MFLGSTMADVVSAARRRAPPPPGAILREDVMPSLDITVTAAADHLHITRQQLHRILSEESGISPEMALRLGKFCGNGPHLWLRMQEAYDLWHAEQRVGEDVATIPTMEHA